tara:strand:+ start:674 stop:949 length:276 start_codon:yes stop_codon:yes gene_type:complete
MLPISIVNEILPLVTRAIDTGDLEMIEEAQSILKGYLADDWADEEVNNLFKNLNGLVIATEADCYRHDENDDEDDGQPSELQEWHDFDPDC